jgi:hypothetical protein
MFLQDIQNRESAGTDLTLPEVLALRKLLSQCAPGYQIKKVPKKTKTEIGVRVADPMNPVTGFEYSGSTKDMLALVAGDENWCGQFAGRKQWIQAGRRVKANQEPCYEYNSIYSSKENPKTIQLFGFEQTEKL